MLSIDVIQSLVLNIDLQHLHLHDLVDTVHICRDHGLLLRLNCILLSILPEHRPDFFLFKDQGRPLVVLDLFEVTSNKGIQDYLGCVLARNVAIITGKGPFLGYLFSDILDVELMVVLACLEANRIKLVLVLVGEVIQRYFKITGK